MGEKLPRGNYTVHRPGMAKHEKYEDCEAEIKGGALVIYTRDGRTVVYGGNFVAEKEPDPVSREMAKKLQGL